MHLMVLILHRIGGINFAQGEKEPGPIVDAKMFNLTKIYYETETFSPQFRF